MLLLYHVLSDLSRTFFWGQWWELNPLSPKANVSKVATLLYLSLFIGGSPFYLTAICALIVSYFKGFVKGFFTFFFDFVYLNFRKSEVVSISPWHPYCITTRAICQGVFGTFFFEFIATPTIHRSGSWVLPSPLDNDSIPHPPSKYKMEYCTNPG